MIYSYSFITQVLAYRCILTENWCKFYWIRPWSVSQTYKILVYFFRKHFSMNMSHKIYPFFSHAKYVFPWMTKIYFPDTNDVTKLQNCTKRFRLKPFQMNQDYYFFVTFVIFQANSVFWSSWDSCKKLTSA